jgi:hypothetical protein
MHRIGMAGTVVSKGLVYSITDVQYGRWRGARVEEFVND